LARPYVFSGVSFTSAYSKAGGETVKEISFDAGLSLPALL